MAADPPDPPAPPVPPGPAQLVGSFVRALGSSKMEGMPQRREHGDRHHFLAEARRRLADGVAANRVHPLPEDVVPDPAHPPPPRFGPASGEDLLVWFVAAVEDAGGSCHVVDGDIPETLLDDLVSEFDAWEVVVSAEPEAQAVGERLAARGVEVGPASGEAAARAGMGVTSASAGIAATGSVVLDSSRVGGRAVSALPPVHLCVLPAERIVATPSEVLRPLGDDPAAVPPSVVLVTGPSRSGDIEQILTVGAHGPAELHVIVVR